MKPNKQGFSLQTEESSFFVPEMRILCLCAQMINDLPMLAACTNTAPARFKMSRSAVLIYTAFQNIT
jgi:hypothetical protein